MTETMEQCMSKTRGDYGSGVTRPSINQDTHFKIKGQFLKELRDNTFSVSEHEDANKHIEKVLKIVGLFHIPKITQDQIMLRSFHVSLTRVARRWLRNQPSCLITTWEEPDESLFHAWERFKELLMKCPQHYLTDMQEVILFYNGLDVPTRQILDSKGAIPSKTATDAKIAIQEMAEYSQKWHNGTSSKTRSTETSDGLAGPHYTKDCPQKEEGKTLEETYYTQFGAPYQPRGQYRAAGTGFYQRNNGNSLHEENSNIIKEIRASTDAVIRNQGASIKNLEIQIGQMTDFSEILRIGCGTYVVSGTRHRSILSETVPFPRRLQNFGCDDWREAQDVKILDAYDHTLPQKEKDLGSFTLSCFIQNICFDKALVDLGASVSVMPFSTYTNLSLGILSHTRLTIELADRTIKQPSGIAKNVLIRIGKFIFHVDFIILDIPEDDDLPLILE
ncbi:hypothetical protein Tco_1015658 [Tanacetum coccineum]|uniref:Retrotransposon gag domain-containing protein n=1 Tax=Tanacetum coccineum TaxID=301880 RepID=A0ABQ5FMJ4_9ASTR